MNLVLFLLSFLFASYAPTAQTTDDGNQNGTTIRKHDHKKGKGGKNTNGDYIICNDIYP